MEERKSKLEQKVQEGIYGAPELKKEEKDRFLGEFRERVIRCLTYKQVIEPGTYPEILQAIRRPEASKLVIDREINLEAAQDYIKLARENGLAFKTVDSPDFKGDVALVVVSDEAVDTKTIQILPRMERLRSLGISDKIIKNVGAKLCKECWNELQKKTPEEVINYQKISFIDKLMGIKCVCQ